MKIGIELNSKKIVVTLIVVAIGFFLLTVLIHKMALQSEPYRVSEQFLQSNNLLKETLGSPIRIEMSLFSGVTISDKAEFNLNIYGTKTNGKVRIELIEDKVSWQVTSAKLFMEGSKVIELYGSK